MLPSLVIEKPCAAVADLSPAKRAAVIECFNNRGLHKCNGYWWGPPEGKHISGVTVADLARDGVFTVFKNLRHGSAQLTERGQWFARTLIAAASRHYPMGGAGETVEADETLIARIEGEKKRRRRHPDRGHARPCPPSRHGRADSRRAAKG